MDVEGFYGGGKKALEKSKEVNAPKMLLKILQTTSQPHPIHFRKILYIQIIYNAI
jgi:hypothetical protein